MSVGKTGFTATCGPIGSWAPCELHSPFANRSHAEYMRKLLLTRPHDWNGELSVSPHACDADFFLSYQATWGAIPLRPDSLPGCMRLTNGASTPPGRKPVLWVVNGGGLHEMEFCSDRRWSLPQIVLRNFGAAALRDTVVWQPAGGAAALCPAFLFFAPRLFFTFLTVCTPLFAGGFLMRSSRRFKGECATIDADQVAAVEHDWLAAHGVRHYNYTALALDFAPLMFDAIHFTYYWVPCERTFPEMARLVAQLGLQSAAGHPVEVCSASGPRPGRADEALLRLGVPLGLGADASGGRSKLAPTTSAAAPAPTASSPARRPSHARGNASHASSRKSRGGRPHIRCVPGTRMCGPGTRRR